MDEKYDRAVEELAQEGRSRIIQYCDMGMEDIETVRRLTALDDHDQFSTPGSAEIVTDACAAATTLSINFGQLAKVLTALLILADSQKKEED